MTMVETQVPSCGSLGRNHHHLRPYNESIGVSNETAGGSLHEQGSSSGLQ